MIRSLTDVQFWIERQAAQIRYPVTPPAPCWFRHVSHLLIPAEGRCCLEIGAVPGETLYFFRRLGYRCTGVDFSPRMSLLAGAFGEHGLAARLIEANFLEWAAEEQFDLVYSCGFVEHFVDFQAVIDRHWALVRPGGLLLLTVPTPTPVQYLLRLACYTRPKRREVFAAHNRDAMNLRRLRRAVDRCEGSEVLAATHAGEMAIWFAPGDDGVRLRTTRLFPMLRRLERAVARTGRSSSVYSPEAVVVARKARS